MVNHGQAWVRELPEHFPAFISEAETAAITESINGLIAGPWAVGLVILTGQPDQRDGVAGLPDSGTHFWCCFF